MTDDSTPSAASEDMSIFTIPPSDALTLEDWSSALDAAVKVDFAQAPTLPLDSPPGKGSALVVATFDNKAAKVLGMPIMSAKRRRGDQQANDDESEDADSQATSATAASKRQRTTASSSDSTVLPLPIPTSTSTSTTTCTTISCRCPTCDASTSSVSPPTSSSKLYPISHHRALTILALPLLGHIRYALLDTMTLSQKVTNDGIVPSWVVIQAMASQHEPQAPKLLPLHMYTPRSFLFRFDTQLHLDGEWEVVKDGLVFRNVIASECSLTTHKPLVREMNDDRVVIFEVALGELPCSHRKGFFGIGLMAQPLERYKDGVTSKQNGTLYYSNGWISSFGSTLDKSGNVPPYDINDRVGLEIDFKANTLMFLLNGAPACAKVPLNPAFVGTGAKLYPAVRLKSRTTATIVSA
jgi:hypothetical protein